ncbi:lysine N(6)-hydroxylase/L-ornithine N(5)-oxygenase family protein [Agrobacterium vitis]|uniref:SidA/IucD/PvdA family monooxygenase n=1 Tax=Agrobacterium vitis TaxID=373 RepID=A0AAE4WE44_AGRVI|nr:SidA/IucD/PvdA family monooxygenase [Agrobacterium vitis]MCF1500016.1 lysine N(6)-hydroxylase/L-ornithine N(5)-oxygenase family protein [Allorhizobium sp. Av2]MCM2442299.1 lysine N(6)-hydroxylase/L-ornithine N(5)-oxygenase family protein [Agrobacterium vitis]MUZ58709.1 SidA/IucD/PvdA family monooxygenase [Agrobacterium vitis]MVA66344.1 SidA/IucD/PvdA family monooxygenase [Agrobacterium vitis]MVA88381.1 SidA/IucD/PvdA family monooxygenase [Agrobacterium vitis]
MKTNKPHHVDVLGIGFGPSNISLAVASEELGSSFSVHFLEAGSGPAWHPHMMLDGSDIQNNPLRDLVTPRNPRSQYSFTNYLKCENRLFDYLNLGLAYPFRKDYARYVAWVARFFDHCVSYSTRAESIRFDRATRLWSVTTNQGHYSARALVLGTGRSRNIPEYFKPALGPRVFHLCDYLRNLSAIGDQIKSIAVIGASQSAVEINLDLMARFPSLEIHSVHRSFAMRQKDTSPFSDYVYFPEFVDYFFSVNDEARKSLQGQLRATNYSAADIDVLHKLYVSLYEEKLEGKERFTIHNNTEITSVAANGQSITLGLWEKFLDRHTALDVDAVVLATGFKDIGAGEGCELLPPILSEVAQHLGRRKDGALDVTRDYSVPTDIGAPLYLNGLCESSHGLGDAGSFSLLSIRSAAIVDSLGANLSIHPHLKDGTGEALQELPAA